MESSPAFPYVQAVIIDEELPTMHHEITTDSCEETSTPQVVAVSDIAVISDDQVESGMTTAPASAQPLPDSTVSLGSLSLGEGANMHVKLLKQQYDATRRRNCWVLASVGVSMFFCLVLVPLLYFGVFIRSRKSKEAHN